MSCLSNQSSSSSYLANERQFEDCSIYLSSYHHEHRILLILVLISLVHGLIVPPNDDYSLMEIEEPLENHLLIVRLILLHSKIRWRLLVMIIENYVLVRRDAIVHGSYLVVVEVGIRKLVDDGVVF
jgi:hypothetical protein